MQFRQKIKNLKGYRLSRPYYRGYSSTTLGVRFLSRPAAVTSLAAAAATVLWYSTKQVVYNDASSLRSAIGEDDQSGVLVGIVFGSNR